jgi:hypothetical protein
MRSPFGQVENAVSNFDDYERKVVEIAMRRHAQPDSLFSTRIGSLFNQAMQRVVQPEADAPAPALVQPVPARQALQLTRHPLSAASRFSVQPSGLALPADAAAHFEHLSGHLLGRHQAHPGFWAFLPDEQLQACGLDAPALENLVLSQGTQHEWLMFNPYGDVTAFHRNPFLLAEQAAPGVLAAGQAFADALKLGVRLADWVSCSDSFLLGLNFVAKRRVWLDWLELADRLLRSQDPRVAEHRDALYALSGNFILMANAPAAHAVDPFTLKALGQVCDTLLEQAMACDGLKASHVRSGHARYLAQHLDKLAPFITANVRAARHRRARKRSTFMPCSGTPKR